MSKKILGIDCSSTTIGLGYLEVIDGKIKYIGCTYIKPIKSNDITIRLKDTRDKLLRIINKFKPDDIVIEEIVSYMPGKSSANTIITLAVFNRMVALLAHDYLKKCPEFYRVIPVRSGLKLGTDFPEKEEIPNIIATHLNVKFPWLYNKKSNVCQENFDMADALAVALFHAFVLTGKCKKPPTIAETKSKKKIARAKKKAKLKRK